MTPTLLSACIGQFASKAIGAGDRLFNMNPLWYDVHARWFITMSDIESVPVGDDGSLVRPSLIRGAPLVRRYIVFNGSSMRRPFRFFFTIWAARPSIALDIADS